jgi:hypothetical protein
LTFHICNLLHIHNDCILVTNFFLVFVQMISYVYLHQSNVAPSLRVYQMSVTLLPAVPDYLSNGARQIVAEVESLGEMGRKRQKDIASYMLRGYAEALKFSHPEDHAMHNHMNKVGWIIATKGFEEMKRIAACPVMGEKVPEPEKPAPEVDPKKTSTKKTS